MATSDSKGQGDSCTRGEEEQRSSMVAMVENEMGRATAGNSRDGQFHRGEARTKLYCSGPRILAVVLLNENRGYMRSDA